MIINIIQLDIDDPVSNDFERVKLSSGEEFSSQVHVKSPERQLLWAIIKRAALDYAAKKYKSRGDNKELADWLSSTADHEFSFVWICQYIDRDPGKLRKLIMSVTGKFRKRYGKQQDRRGLSKEQYLAKKKPSQLNKTD